MTACAPATTQKCSVVRITADAATAARPAAMMHARFRLVASTSAPAGTTAIMPTMAPRVITAPIEPVAQPRPASRTARNGPIPAAMSAMKKFIVCSETRSRAAAFGRFT